MAASVAPVAQKPFSVLKPTHDARGVLLSFLVGVVLEGRPGGPHFARLVI